MGQTTAVHVLLCFGLVTAIIPDDANLVEEEVGLLCEKLEVSPSPVIMGRCFLNKQIHLS